MAGGFTKKITDRLGGLAEVGTLLVLLPVGLAVGWVSLAAAPVITSWLGRLRAPAQGGNTPTNPTDPKFVPKTPAQNAPVATARNPLPTLKPPEPRIDNRYPVSAAPPTVRPTPTAAPVANPWVVVLNPGLNAFGISAFAGHDTKANLTLSNLVQTYLQTGANRVQVVNLGKFPNYNQRLIEIAKLARQNRRMVVLTLGSLDTSGQGGNGNIIYAVPQRYGVVQNENTISMRDLGLKMGKALANSVAVVYNQFERLDKKTVRQPLDTFQSYLGSVLNPFAKTDTVYRFERDSVFHNTLYDGIYKGGAFSAAFKSDEALIIDPRNSPRATPSVYLNYADNSVDKGLLRALREGRASSKTFPYEWKAAEELAGRIALALRQQLGAIK